MDPSTEGPCPKCQTPNVFSVTFCAFCGARLPWAAPQSLTQTPTVATPPPAGPPPKPVRQPATPLVRIGALLLTGGLLAVIFFLFLFQVTVDSGTDRVNNIGLIADRQNGLMVGLTATVCGVAILLVEYVRVWIDSK